MQQNAKRSGKWVAMALCVTGAFSAPVTYAQSTKDIKELRKQVETLQAGQKDIQKQVETLHAGQIEMQKTLQIIKDIAMGKQPPLEDVYISTSSAYSQGDDKAKLVMVEFSDFQCPFCGRYAAETYTKILEDYVKSGKVRYVMRNFPLEQIHPLAEKAAEAAECAGEQGRYWDMHDRLFKNQQALDAKEMSRHAVVLGLDQFKFQQCFDSGKYTAKVKADVAEGIRFRVTGTPSFFFGYPDTKDPSKMKAVKSLSGAQPLGAFTSILDDLLNPKEKEQANEKVTRN